MQAKDISNVEILEQAESERSIALDGIRRIRKRRNYRERPLYVMDTRQFYIKIICIIIIMLYETMIKSYLLIEITILIMQKFITEEPSVNIRLVSFLYL